MILMDNASYNKSTGLLQFLADYRVPVLYTGPMSYDASPIELLFAHFKKEDINPRHLAMGKK